MLVNPVIGERAYRLTSLSGTEIPLYLVEVEITQAFGGYLTVREIETKVIYNIYKDKWNTLYRTEEEVRAFGLQHFSDCLQKVKKAEKDFKGVLQAIRSEGSEVKA